MEPGIPRVLAVTERALLGKHDVALVRTLGALVLP